MDDDCEILGGICGQCNEHAALYNKVRTEHPECAHMLYCKSNKISIEAGMLIAAQLCKNPDLWHYGIVVKTGYIAELVGTERNYADSRVRMTPFPTFVQDFVIKVFPTTNPRESINRAFHYVRNPNLWPTYNIVTNNCEHFARFCATGEMESKQVNKVLSYELRLQCRESIVEQSVGVV